MKSQVKKYFKKAQRKIKRWRLRPISVFLFHQVSDSFDQATMKAGDWTQTGQFKRNVEQLLKEYRFIPLDEAYHKMQKDFLRRRKYAVLTSDDGWASLNDILPWLEERGIPVTLFLNPGYFDGEHFREKNTEKYLLQKDIDSLASRFPHVSIGLHGWEHTRATEQDEKEFRENVTRSVQALKGLNGYIPFFAYTYGSFNAMTDRVLREFGLIPVAIDREKNVDDLSVIHRELLDGMKL